MTNVNPPLSLILEIVRKEFRDCDVELSKLASDNTVTATVRCKKRRPPTENKLKYLWNPAIPSWKKID